MTTDYIRSYSELLKLKTFDERLEYLMLNGKVGEELFGFERYLNQHFYHDVEWYSRKNKIILRDGGNELGVPGYKIVGTIYVHHINPITVEQVKNHDPCLYDPENLISCGFKVHQAITWGNKNLIPQEPIIRRPNDTCPWKD